MIMNIGEDADRRPPSSVGQRAMFVGVMTAEGALNKYVQLFDNGH